jgi:hypothetical protein
MFYPIHPDVVGPGVYIIFGLTAFLVFLRSSLSLRLLWLLKWDAFGRSLLPSFLMNLASTILGILLIGLSLIGLLNDFLGFVISFMLSVLIEGGVLMLMKRDATRENWRVASIANVISYSLLGIFLLAF